VILSSDEEEDDADTNVNPPMHATDPEPEPEHCESTSNTEVNLNMTNDVPPLPHHENPPTTVDPMRTRYGRARRARDLTVLSECVCGVTVSSDEILEKQAVIQCKKAGCETQWVSNNF
jgi:hypothetical protein